MKTKTLLLIGALIYASFLSAQNQNPTADYNASTYNGQTILTEEVLENYLDRAATVAGLVHLNCTTSSHYDPVLYAKLVDELIVETDIKFIGRMAGFWGGEGILNIGYMAAVANTILDINNKYTTIGRDEPIMHTVIYEAITPEINYVAIPQEVQEHFNQFDPNAPQLYFNYNDMLYDNGHYHDEFSHTPLPNGVYQYIASVPDITKIQTQMWFYYLATEYINAGVEAIQMGQIALMSENDIGLHTTYQLFEDIRTYAITNAPRNFVLFSAEPNLEYTPPVGDKVLLFNFLESPMRMEQQAGTEALDMQSNNGGQCYVKQYNAHTGAAPELQPMFNRSGGGLTSFGWETDALPYLVEFDNYDMYNQGGMLTTTWEINHWYLWGYDHITWFAYLGLDPQNDVHPRISSTGKWSPHNHSFPGASYRNDWLKYAYYKAKCIDPKANIQMPGNRVMTTWNYSGSGTLYPRPTYNAVNFGQVQTIKDIWNGTFDVPNYWEEVDFNSDEVVYPATTLAVEGLVQIGDDKIYWIGADKRINGYVKNSANEWITISPSWAATNIPGGTPILNQPLAKVISGQKTLISNPSGTHLYYLGEDGQIHGFEINDIWSYTHFTIDKGTNPSISEGSLVCPADNRIYFQSYDANSLADRIYGAIKNGPNNTDWAIISLSWAAHGAANDAVNILAQAPIESSLVSNPSGDVLYYIGTDNYIYSYEINSDWSYTYKDLSKCNKAKTSLICPKDHQLFFVSLSSDKLYLMVKNGQTWGCTNVSGNAESNTMWIGNPLANYGTSESNQVRVLNNLTSNASGTQIFYKGTDSKIHCYNILADWVHSYTDNNSFRATQSTQLGIPCEGSFSMNSDDELFYISDDNEVRVMRHSYCFNPAITAVESTHNTHSPLKPQEPNNNNNNTISEIQVLNRSPYDVVNTTTNVATKTNESPMEGFQLNVYPNPSSAIFNINVESYKEQDVQINITDVIGHEIYSESMDLPNGSSLISISAKEWTNGVYLISIKDRNGNLLGSKKLIKS